MRRGLGRPEVAPHLPADPQQDQSAREGQADDPQQPGGQQREDDAQRHRRAEAREDGGAPLQGGQTRGRHAHGHGVVASQGQVDQQDLQQDDEILDHEMAATSVIASHMR